MFISNVVYGTVMDGILYIGNPGNLLSIVFYLLVFYCLVYFNYVDSGNAYTGILLYVFNVVVNFILGFFLEFGFSLVNIFLSGDIAVIAVGSISLLFTVLTIVSGILVYVRSKAYLRNRYANWRALRNWSLLFTVLSILSSLSTLVLLILPIIGGHIDISLLFMVFECLVPSSIALSCFFTLMRLKGF